MSYKNGIVYDLTKNIKDLEINTGFIMGLNDILLYWMTNILPDVAKLPATLEKFKTIITSEDPSKEHITLSVEEKMLYTLYALQMLLKQKAKEQNLELESKTEVTEENLKEYLASFVDKTIDGNKDPKSALSDIMTVINNKSS
jgi:hypothetical protein